jgi:signal transduction histidine kinase
MEETTEHIIPVRTDIKLLIVDDREDNLISIETILEKDGYIIRTADSGRAALRVLLKESDFTLILMDVQMPGLNGFETATLIYERDKLKHIPIIFVTANDYGEDSVFKGYKMGGVDYIYKPINADLLRAKVGVFVELYKKNHELYAQEQETAAANKRLEKEIQDRIRSEAKVKLLNKQLLENISNLETTNAELERFAYVASHDLQEPLRKIILFSDQVAAKYKHQLNDEGQDYIMRIMKAADRMRMLIKNILTYSKYAVNSQDLEETDLNKLVDEILSDLEISIEQKKAIFSIEALPTLHIMPGQLRQVFQNLILNALKFSKDGRPPEIHIYTDVSYVQNDLHNEAYCNIYVKDNGIGFEQKYADDIFTLFKRLNSKDTFEGTGIGLSICKKIIAQHKGFISATSMVDEGTTFTISLPLKEVQSN